MGNVSAVKATPPTTGDKEKAERLSAAIKQVFQGHKAKLGSKTLMTVAYCWAAER